MIKREAKGLYNGMGNRLDIVVFPLLHSLLLGSEQARRSLLASAFVDVTTDGPAPLWETKMHNGDLMLLTVLSSILSSWGASRPVVHPRVHLFHR